MDTTQAELIRRLRHRLLSRAYLAEDESAYADGVEDALEEVTQLLDSETTLDLMERPEPAGT